MNQSRRAVITGLGPLTCIGIGKEAFWQGLVAEKSGIARCARFDTSSLNAHAAGEISDWEPGRFFPPHRHKRLDRYAQFSVHSARLAIEDAQLNVSPDQPTSRIGVSYGTALGGIANAEIEHARFMQGGSKAVTPTLALQVFGGSAHSNIAIEFGLRGVGTTNSNSCASGAVAIGDAFRYIRDGYVDVMIAGAAEAPLSPLTYSAFAFIKTMSQYEGDPIAKACRPFDIKRDGFVMGEGGASLVIEELEHARARGAHIYAEVRGYSLNNDAYHMTSPLPDGASCIRAMKQALAEAELEPQELDYINAHASSTQLNDSTESRCIREVLGTHAERPLVSGTKAYTAHPLGATGAIEAIICCLALENAWVPPTLHVDQADPACQLNLVLNHAQEKPLQHILSNSFGFGGINSCLILSKPSD